MPLPLLWASCVASTDDDLLIASAAIDFGANSDGRLLANGKPFHIKGAVWFGAESHGAPLGLAERRAVDLLDFLSGNDFNAVRLLFNWEDFVADLVPPRGTISAQLNPDLVSLSYRALIRNLVRLAASRGMLVVLACQRIRRSYGPGHADWPGSWDGLWYDDEYTEDRVIGLWTSLARELCAEWNVVGVDLMGEPHGATWGDANPATDWAAAAGRLGSEVQASCERWLILVQGVADPGQWGENLHGSVEHPVVLPDRSKLVLAPHTFGPSLFARPEFAPEEFSSPDFPANLADTWEERFGFVTGLGVPLIVGEAGGSCVGRDEMWHRALVSELSRAKASGLFYAYLNPGSARIGGLLADDWTTPISAKLRVLAPLPSTRVVWQGPAGPLQGSASKRCAVGVWSLTLKGSWYTHETWASFSYVGARTDDFMVLRVPTPAEVCASVQSKGTVLALWALPPADHGSDGPRVGSLVRELSCGNQEITISSLRFQEDQPSECRTDTRQWSFPPDEPLRVAERKRTVLAGRAASLCSGLDATEDARAWRPPDCAAHANKGREACEAEFGGKNGVYTQCRYEMSPEDVPSCLEDPTVLRCPPPSPPPPPPTSPQPPPPPPSPPSTRLDLAATSSPTAVTSRVGEAMKSGAMAGVQLVVAASSSKLAMSQANVNSAAFLGLGLAVLCICGFLVGGRRCCRARSKGAKAHPRGFGDDDYDDEFDYDDDDDDDDERNCVHTKTRSAPPSRFAPRVAPHTARAGTTWGAGRGRYSGCRCEITSI